MKFFMKLMIGMTVLALAGPFFLKGPDGRPLMNVSALGLNKLPNLLTYIKSLNLTSFTLSETTDDNAKREIDGLVLGNGDQVYYRWQDENGIWQFTAEPPPANISDYQPVITNPNANIIQSLKKNQIDKALGRPSGNDAIASNTHADQQSKTAEISQELEAASEEAGLPLTSIPKLIEQTKQIRSTMEQRNQMLDQL